MTNTEALKSSYQTFAKAASPYLHIRNETQYKRTLEFLEELLEEAEDNVQDPLNGLIELLSHAISHYEERVQKLQIFEKRAHKGPSDVAMLRLLMEQHQLGVADLPEIGDKSLVSKILSGERNLTKQHIQKLSKRFKISAALFF